MAQAGRYCSITCSSRASSRTSPRMKTTSLPVISRTRRRDTSLELHRLSTTMGVCPASSSSTQVWLPMYPAPPVTSTFML